MAITYLTRRLILYRTTPSHEFIGEDTQETEIFFQGLSDCPTNLSDEIVHVHGSKFKQRIFRMQMFKFETVMAPVVYSRSQGMRPSDRSMVDRHEGQGPDQYPLVVNRSTIYTQGLSFRRKLDNQRYTLEFRCFLRIRPRYTSAYPMNLYAYTMPIPMISDECERHYQRILLNRSALVFRPPRSIQQYILFQRRKFTKG